ncbi:MAG TPA: SRPBCC family protein [Sphingobacteriaceae bacterium]|nr:SRPBCC family protein [Sphingobacteriaceae bacterium]
MELQYQQKPGFSGAASKNNISTNIEWPERYISVLAGISLISSGIKKLGKNPLKNLVKSAAGGYLLYRGLTGSCPLYSRIGKHNTTSLNVNIRESVTVKASRAEVYSFWRKLNNLPLFMKHLKEVTVLDSKRSHWEVKLPANVAKISWNAEIVEDHPGNMIGWQSVRGSMIYNAGKVEFKDLPNGEGTLINVVISYTPPAGGVGTAVGKLLNPLFEKMVREDITNFKEYIETQTNWNSSQDFINDIETSVV